MMSKTLFGIVQFEFIFFAVSVLLIHCTRREVTDTANKQIVVVEKKLGKDYKKEISPEGGYTLYYKKSKPFSEKPVSVISFVVLSNAGIDVLYERQNFQGDVEWVSENIIRLREQKGILLDNDTNIFEYYYNVSLGKRIDHLKSKEL